MSLHRAMLTAVTDAHRRESLDLLRKAACHYGNTLRDEDESLSIADAAAKRDEVKLDRITDLRRAVHQVADGRPSRTKAEAGHEDAVLRALLHFDAEMTPELRQYVYTRLSWCTRSSGCGRPLSRSAASPVVPRHGGRDRR